MTMTLNTLNQPQQLPAQVKRRSHAPLYWILAICIAPTIAAFTLFYAVDWSAKANTDTTNYGELLPNPAVMPNLTGAQQVLGSDNTQLFDAKIIYKKWVYLTVDRGACDEPCAKRLFTTRQLRAMMGRERERIARLWLVTDDAPVDARLFAAHPDLIIVRVKPEDLTFLSAQNGHTIVQQLWMVDPLGRPMMRYSAEPEPERMKKDLTKLLYASKAWQN
jgi:hypothetical protein